MPTPKTPLTIGISRTMSIRIMRGDMLVAKVVSEPIEQMEEDAAHIVRCVNAHDKLVAALKGLLDKFQQEYDQLTDGEFGDIEEFANVKKDREALKDL